MSAYVTQAELEAIMYAARLEDCTDDDADGSSDAAIVTRVINSASSVADGFFAHVSDLTLPLTGTDLTDAVKHHVGFLAAHYAAKRRPQFRDKQGRAPYWEEAAEAMAWFAAVAAGRVLLRAADRVVPWTNAADIETPWSDLAAGVDSDGEPVTGGF